MSKATQQEIRSLYRSYLRIVKEWPEDKIRLNRGMKQILSKRVEETFRTGQEKDTLDLSKQHRELEALEFLLDNKFKDKVKKKGVLFLEKKDPIINNIMLRSIRFPIKFLLQQEIQIITPN